MSATLIDGKRIAEKMKKEARATLAPVLSLGVSPTLAVILVGDDPASEVYVRQKERACKEVGLRSKTVRLHASCTQEELDAAISAQADDPNTVGILVQLPLPPHLDTARALSYVPHLNDVDGFTKLNTGKLWSGDDSAIVPCTPRGILYALDETGIDLAGKHVVVVGRSNTVGKPLAALMLKRDATVTVCHSKTQNLADFTKQADVLVCAVGKPNLITGDMVKPGAVVIDVGINRVNEEDAKDDLPPKTRLVGDVHFASVSRVASHITPVPGGVGPLTVAALMLNTCANAKHNLPLMLYYKKDETPLWEVASCQESS